MSDAPEQKRRRRPQPSERVYAIVGKRDDGTLGVFGPGVYRGDEVPPADTPGWPGDIGRAGIANPAILLDTGEVVYGCECWWGPEDATLKSIEGAELVTETVASYRARAAALQEGAPS